MKIERVARPHASHPHMKRQKLSVSGKTSYEHQGKMAFPSSAPAADMAQPASPAPPMMGGGGGALPPDGMSGGGAPGMPPE